VSHGKDTRESFTGLDNDGDSRFARISAQLGIEATASGLGRTPDAIIARAKELKIKLGNLPI
jgi:hypothetical protein